MNIVETLLDMLIRIIMCVAAVMVLLVCVCVCMDVWMYGCMDVLQRIDKNLFIQGYAREFLHH